MLPTIEFIWFIKYYTGQAHNISNKLYKKRTKRWHDRRIQQKDFKEEDSATF